MHLLHFYRAPLLFFSKTFFFYLFDFTNMGSRILSLSQRHESDLNSWNIFLIPLTSPLRFLLCWQLPKNQAHENVRASLTDANAALAPVIKFKWKTILRSGHIPKEESWQSSAILRQKGEDSLKGKDQSCSADLKWFGREKMKVWDSMGNMNGWIWMFGSWRSQRCSPWAANLNFCSFICPLTSSSAGMPLPMVRGCMK